MYSKCQKGFENFMQSVTSKDYTWLSLRASKVGNMGNSVQEGCSTSAKLSSRLSTVKRIRSSGMESHENQFVPRSSI